MHFDSIKIIDTIYFIENKQFIYKCNHLTIIGLMSNECLYGTKLKNTTVYTSVTKYSFISL